MRKNKNRRLFFALWMCFLVLGSPAGFGSAQGAWIRVPDVEVMVQFRTIWGASQNEIYVAGDYCNLNNFDGSTLTPIALDFERTVYDIWGSSVDNVYGAADSGNLYHYDGTEWSWQKLTVRKLRGVWGLGENHVFVGGDVGTLFFDNGTGWRQIPLPAGTSTLQDIWGTAPDNIYAVGGKSKSDPTSAYDSFIIHYDGSEWAVQWTGTIEQKLKTVWGPTPDNLFATGEWLTILHSTDGSTWTPVELDLDVPEDAEIRGIAGLSANSIYASADYTTILHFNGTQWMDVSDDIDNSTGSIPETWRLQDIWAYDAENIYAVGDAGTILRYYADYDGDGYDFPDDCLDADAMIHPGAMDVCDDGIDNDCDGVVDECCIDEDGDGVYLVIDGDTCTAYDCNDADEHIFPGAEDACGDNIDNDCDGIVDECCIDADGDGAFTVVDNMTCSVVDCNDNASAISPDALEICDGVDNDCDNETDESGAVCTVGTGACSRTGNYICEDGANAACNAVPGDPTGEACGDGVDNDCDGSVDEGCGGNSSGGNNPGNTDPITTTTTTVSVTTPTTTTTVPAETTTTTTVEVAPAPETTTTTTVKNRPCALRRQLADRPEVLTALRSLRDRRLMRTSNGADLGAGYYRHGWELVSICVRHPELAGRIAGLLTELAPRISSALDQNAAITIGVGQYSAVRVLASELQGYASAGLKAFVGEAVEQMESGTLLQDMGIVVE